MDYDSNNKIKDILDRSKKNLEIIKHYKGYDITQLFNNFIMALVLIKEKNKVSEKDIQEYNLTCTLVKNTYDKDFSNNAKELIRHLRNSFCHYNYDIYPDENGEISYINFRDKRIDCCKIEECEFEMTIEEIKKVYNYLLRIA